MIFRDMRGSDFDSVIKIFDDVFDEARADPNFGDYTRLKKPTEKAKLAWKKNVYNDIKRRNAVWCVAEEKGKAIGFCFVIKKEIPDSEISHVGVLGVNVSKMWRGKGIGTKLVKYALKISKNRFEIIELCTFKTNRIAKELFRSLGFKTWGIAPGYVKRDNKYIDLEYMYLRL